MKSYRNGRPSSLRPPVWRPTASLLIATLLSLACAAPTGAPAAAPPAEASPTPAPVTVRVGTLGTVGDAGWWVALDQGYFREQGINFEYTQFDSAANMIAPLASEQLDVAGGAISAGLYNAIARGVEIKAVADKSSSPPGHGTTGLVIRKDLWESGRVRSAADLRGMRIAFAGAGAAPMTEANAFLQTAGLSLNDLDVVTMSFGDQVGALANSALDIAIVPEPFLTTIRNLDAGHLWMRSDELLPGHMIAVVMYSAKFATEQPDVGRRLLVAYLRAVRDYNDAFFKNDPSKRKIVVEALTKYTPLKDPALYDEMVVQGLDPNGAVSLASLEQDQEYFLASGQQQQRIDLSKVVDTSFADAALRTLGPYH